MKQILLLLLATIFCATLYAQYPSNTTKTRNLATGGIWWTNGDAAGTYDGRGRIYDTTSMSYLDSVGTLRFLDGTSMTTASSSVIKPKVSSASSLNLYANDTFYIYNGSSTATWTLPLIASSSNKQIYVKNRGEGVVTIQRSGANQIYASTLSFFVLLYPGQSGTFYNDGTYWLYNQNVSGSQVLSGTSTVNTDLFTDIYNIDPVSVRNSLTVNISGFSGQTQKFTFGGQIPNGDTVIRNLTWNTSYIYGKYPATVLSGDVLEITYLYNPNTFDIIPFASYYPVKASSVINADSAYITRIDSVSSLEFNDGTRLTSANFNLLSGFSKSTAFNLLDGQRKPIRYMFSYFTDTALFNGVRTVGNDYYRNPNVIINSDTMYTTVVVTKGHDYTQGFMRLIKYTKCGKTFPWGVMPCNRTLYQYTNQVSDVAIKYENNILAPNLLNDTVYGIRYTAPYPSDTILKLNRNFDRIGVGAVYFNKAASHVQSSFLSLSKIIKDDSGYFYMAGYERPGNNYIGVLLRSLTPNSIENWDTIRTFPFIDNIQRLEECAVWRGDGDTIVFAARSDFGNKTLIAKCIYGRCSNILSSYKGANQPKGLTYSDSMVVGTGRVFGYPSLDGEIVTLDDTTSHTEVFNYRAYTTFSVSWDYGNNWSTYYLDRIRTEAISTGGYGDYEPLTSEVADVVQISGDTFRIFWASGIYVDNTSDYGDLSSADFVINRFQRGQIRFMGGVTKQQTTYQTSINVDSVNVTDTTNDKYFAITVDNRTVNLRTNSDTIRSNAAFHKLTGVLSVNTPEIDTERAFDFRSSSNNEQFTGIGGNVVYARWNTSAPSFRIRQAEGTKGSPTATNANRTLGEWSMGGYEGRYVDNFQISTRSAEAFSSANNRGTNVTYSKIGSGSATSMVIGFIDSINRQWWGHSSTRPSLLTERFYFANGNARFGENQNIKAVRNGSDADTGNVGEYIARYTSIANQKTLTTATVTNIDSITLQPGDWELSGQYWFNLNSANTDSFSYGFSTVSATLPSDTLYNGCLCKFNNVTGREGKLIDNIRFNVSVATKVYFIASSGFSSGDIKVYGYLRARRRR